MEIFFPITIIIILSFLLGSLPSAIIISKIFFGFDIRKKGSGNMGSTNAFRVLGWKWGIVVQIADILKGVVAVLWIAKLFDIDYNIGSEYIINNTITMLIAGISAVCGHIWSVFAKFRGGKGINTTAGILIGISPIDVSLALAIFIIVVIFSGYISLGSISAAITLPTSLFIRYNFFGVDIPSYHLILYFLSGLALLLILAHLSNIKRLLKGSENKFEKLQLIKFKRNN